MVYLDLVIPPIYVAGESHLVWRDLSSPADQEHCDKQDVR